MRPALTLVFLCLLLVSCSGAPVTGPRTLTVFAASSLTEAFTELGAGFESDHPGVTVVFSFGGSQVLRTQIQAGAPADVFAAASPLEMDALAAAGLISSASAQVFVTNQLIVILPAANPAELQQLQDLSRPGLKLVLAAEEVPVGNYARQSLGKMNTVFGPDFGEHVLANVVSNEDNIRQVVAKVQLGEADAGIAYASDAVAAPGLSRIEIPAELNVVARYPIARLTDSPEPALAQAFVDYVLSPAGQAILQSWGFGPAQ